MNNTETDILIPDNDDFFMNIGLWSHPKDKPEIKEFIFQVKKTMIFWNEDFIKENTELRTRDSLTFSY